MQDRIDDRTLELFVTQKYHWNSLNKDQQLAIATELMKARYLLNKQYEFLGHTLEDLNGFRDLGKIIREQL